jgi:hypothetical protein
VQTNTDPFEDVVLLRRPIAEVELEAGLHLGRDEPLLGLELFFLVLGLFVGILGCGRRNGVFFIRGSRKRS